MFTAILCCAQQPHEVQSAADPAALVAQWLDSSDPRLQAWAVYLIRRNNLDNFSWRLEQIVARPPSSGAQQKDWGDVRLAALDALIQMNASLSAFELQDLLDRFPTEALILAIRSPADNSALLLDLFDRAESYEAYVAVGNLLVGEPSPRFVAKLMGSLSIYLQVGVYDFGTNIGANGGGWAGDVYREAEPIKSNWPEIGTYELTESSDGAVLLASGKHPIYYRRTETRIYADHGFRFIGETSGHSRNDRAQEYLAQILDLKPDAFPLQIDRKLSVYWTNGEALKQDIRKSVTEQRRLYSSIAAEFVRRGLLTGDSTLLQPRIYVWLLDSRTTSQIPLPDMAKMAAELGVSMFP